MDTRHVETGDGTRLCARVWPGAGRSFLLVHGLASNARTWNGVASALAAAGHEVVAVDQRGHGQSDKPDHGFDYPTLMADLVDVMGQTGLSQPVVVGQSWGGNVIVELAAGHPELVSGAVAIDGGAIDLRDRFATWDECWSALTPPDLDGMSVEGIVSRLRRSHPDWTDDGIEATLGNLARLDDGTVRPHLSRASHRTIVHLMWDHGPSAALARLTVGLLLIAADGGGSDLDGPTPRPGLEIRALNGDHDLHVQQPDRVVQLILDCLDRGFFS